ncbi:Cysteine desulfurase [compost metagenome]
MPHIINISFPECDAETMLMNLDMEGIAASSGSACTSGSLEPSHVLEAMNLPPHLLRSAIRFSFGLGNTSQEIEETTQKIGTILGRLRKRN